VTNNALLVLPDDLPNYLDPATEQPIDPDTFKLSRAARMSMSIPYFYEPVVLKDKENKDAVIIDGGTLSNFPVWLFDVDPAVAGRPPQRPTYGFTLTGGRGLMNGGGAFRRFVPWPITFGGQIFHTAQVAWDNRFVSHSTRTRTVAIDADNVGTTEFNLSAEKRRLLVSNGREAATEFLDGFDLNSYMNTFHQKLAGA
jgi:NTE family protein